MVRGLVGLGLLVSLGSPAQADIPANTEYAIELYEGVAIGDTSQTGMGGAGAARVSGSAGALLNPSAPAVRRDTDTDSWSWDYHFDFLTGKFSSDYDNNGVAQAQNSGASLVTAGLALRFGKWSGALTVTAQTAPIDGSAPALDAEALRGKFVFARYFDSKDLAVGLGLQTITFQVAPTDTSQPPLFAITGAGAVAGATWLPKMENYRIGVALESKIAGLDVKTDCGMNCQGYVLPTRVVSPGRTIVGFAYRWAETAWNQQLLSKWRDERSVTLATDAVIAGSDDGNGIEAFGGQPQALQPSGRSVTTSLRAGAEVECIPGRLRVRAGSYWEPGRFADVGGRIHGTFGFEVRALEFDLWGLRRGRLGATADVASRYRNLGVSIGFWH